MPNPRPPSSIVKRSKARPRTERTGHDGHKRPKGTNLPLAVDPLGQLLVLHVTLDNVQEREQVQPFATASQIATGEHVELIDVGQGYTGDSPAEVAAIEGIELHVIKLLDAKHGFVLLPRRWVAERSFAWKAPVPAAGPRPDASRRRLWGCTWRPSVR
jgi:transposase